MRRKQLLFSKRDKSEKATGMGDQNESPEKANKNNQKENVSNEVFNKDNKSKNPKKSSNKQIEELKQQLIEERNISISKLNELNIKNEEKSIEIKSLSDNFKKMINKLKEYEKNLTLKTKIRSRNIPIPSEELIKQIKIAEAQINVLEKRVNIEKDNYELFKKNAKKKESKENNLNSNLSELKKEIKDMSNEINELRLISNIHLNCKKERMILFEQYTKLNTSYNYELKRAKQLALMEIAKKLEDDQAIKEEYDKLDEKEKEKEEEKNILPKIKGFRFMSEKLQILEMKIIKKNKIGVNKSAQIGNAIKYYKKLDTEYTDNNRYINQANSNIRKHREKDLKMDDNFLFSENEEKIMNKVLPEKIKNNYQNKFNDILEEKKDIKEKLTIAKNDIKNENELINNKIEYNDMELKNIKFDKLKLVVKSQKLRDKINDLNRNIKEINEQIKKEEKKLQDKEKDEKRIKLYFKSMQANQGKNKKK